MPIFVIVFYKEADGIKPLGEFVKSLDIKMKVAIPKKRRIDYLRRLEAGTYE